MRSISRAAPAAVVLALVAPLALAQPAPPPAQPRPALPAAATATPAPPPLPAPAAAQSAAPSAAGSASAVAAGVVAAKPPAIDVDDPLLAPVAPATKTITGFKEVVALLSNQSVTLRIARAEIDRAKGQKRVTLANVLPTLNGSLQVSGEMIQTTSPTYRGLDCALNPDFNVTTFDELRTCSRIQSGERTSPGDPVGRIGLNLSVPFNPRAYYALGTADQSVTSTELRAEDARRTALVSVANAIVNVVTTERISEISRVGLRAALERLELTKRRKRLGSGTELDIVRAETDAASARGQIVSGDETLRRSRESLGGLFNSSDGYGVPQNFSLNDIEQALKSACQIQKPENRVDVLAAKSDLKVAERGVTDAKLLYAPTASVQSTLSTSTNQSFNAQTGQLSSTASWTISAVLTLPIWDGGARYGQAKIAAANVEQAKARVDQATTTATIESTQAQRAVTVAEQARVVSEKARDLAKETARLSQIAFEAGAGTSLDLIDAGRVLRQAELDLAVKELEVVRSKIAALVALSKCDV